MGFIPMKVGAVARRTGLTIRTLHHYDEIGLLRPSLHNDSGHRLYTAADVARLQQVLSLRQLGLSLDETRACLDRPEFNAVETIRLHLARLRERIEVQKRLCDRLENIAAHFNAAEEVSADEFFQAIEEMTMMDKVYTPEQQEQLKKRAEEIGPDRIRQGSEDWAELIAAVRAEMEKGTDPAAPEVQALAGRWQRLINAFTGGDPGIENSLGRLWKEQGDTLAAQHPPQYDPRGVSEFIGKAMAAGKGQAK